MVKIKKPSSPEITADSKKQLTSGKSSSKNANNVKKIPSRSLKGNSKSKVLKALTDPSNVLKASNRSRQNHNDAHVKENQPKISLFFSSPGKENARMMRAESRKVLRNAENIFPEVKKPVYNSLQAVKKDQEIQSIDVYDISEDEEMQSEDKYPKKKIKRRKGNVKKKIQDKNLKNLQSNHIECIGNGMDGDLQIVPPLKTTKNNPLPAMHHDEIAELAPMSAIPNQTDSQSTIPSTQPTPPESASNFPVQEAPMNEVSFQLDKEAFLSQLADEIERSFLIPQMTSTPAERCGKVQANRPNILEESLLQNTSNDQRAPPSPKRTKNSKDKDIKLFESPKKKEARKCKQPAIKFPASCPEVSFELSPSKVPEELEASVLQPAKSYTPDNNFKTHLARTKRAMAADKKCLEKKTKDQLIIEKMTKHFEEISEMELCIE